MLNHGSFGACPRIVLEAQRLLRAAMERNPIGFFMRQMEPLVDASRLALAGLLGADASDLVFVSNVTEGVNSVMRSLSLEAGDEVLVTDHAYNACRNVVDFVTRRAGAKVVVASVPLPITTREEVVQRITDRVTDRTRLALLDHMASPTAVIFPIEELVRRLDQRGVDTLVDGAHTPGMLPVALGRLGAAYYTGNCHKWLCAPKGAGFLHVRADRQEGLYPAVISHGYNHRRPERPPLHEAFDWTGTDDPTPWLCVAEAIRFCDSLIEGGLEALARRNHQLVLTGQRILCEQLGLAPSCPDEMLGSMAALRLPGATASSCDRIHPLRTHPLQKSLQEQFGIEVPVFHWPAPPHTLVRISAHAYNSPSQYRQLADAIAALR
ncbi:MAG: aminotransferase class V-fold PLP-dependent enzyme [Planctomycetes bacterium]|nr:aminotransferase class V-fold PLP-dependent enzyme [Planctomycetota bacterium]